MALPEFITGMWLLFSMNGSVVTPHSIHEEYYDCTTAAEQVVVLWNDVRLNPPGSKKSLVCVELDKNWSAKGVGKQNFVIEH